MKWFIKGVRCLFRMRQKHSSMRVTKCDREVTRQKYKEMQENQGFQGIGDKVTGKNKIVYSE